MMNLSCNIEDIIEEQLKTDPDFLKLYDVPHVISSDDYVHVALWPNVHEVIVY